MIVADAMLRETREAHADFVRHGVSLLVTVTCTGALALATSDPSWLQAAPSAETPIELMLQEWTPAEEPAPPPAPPPQAATPPEPHSPAPSSTPAPAPALAPTPTATPEPSATTATTTAAAATPATAPPEPPAARAPAPAATPAAPRAEPPRQISASVEAEFIARVRALLNASKRYPTGREASLQRPQGKVRVWFTLARNGGLLDSGLQDSSNSLLLDNAALATVRRAAFAAFPAEAWAGQEQHRFSAELEFVAPGA